MGTTGSLSITTTVVVSDQQISCDVADEVVLLSMQNGEYYGLNSVGASIWRQIQQPRKLADVRDALLGEYAGIGAETCTKEILAFSAEMLSLGLIRVA